MSPRASDDLRAAWPDGQDEAIAHLESRGYRCTRDFDWIKTAGVEQTERDLSAMQYLVDEWDWGWIKEDKA